MIGIILIINLKLWFLMVKEKEAHFVFTES